MTGARRQPTPHDRVRDAERSRSVLLDAGQAEFADKGFAGARVEAIAGRAGLNKQLITYYFGGKQGLYDAVIERWRTREQLDAPSPSLAGVVRRYVDAFGNDPDLERIFLRDNLDRSPDDVRYEPGFGPVQELRERQAAGEIADELDPAFLLLFLQAVTVSGTLFPAEAMRLTGLDPRTAAFRERAADQLSKIIDRMR